MCSKGVRRRRSYIHDENIYNDSDNMNKYGIDPADGKHVKVDILFDDKTFALLSGAGGASCQNVYCNGTEKLYPEKIASSQM